MQRAVACIFESLTEGDLRCLPGTSGGAAAAFVLMFVFHAAQVLSKAFAIDGANRFRLPGGALGATSGVSVDGSRIATTRTGRPAAGCRRPR